MAEETGASAKLTVVTPAAHDTASAVAAVPATGDQNWAFLSSGTWSLLGAELDSPINSSAAREIPFTNERGVQGTIRFLKNIAGLWLVQEVQRELQQQGEAHSFEELVNQARQAELGRTLVDPDFREFATPGGIGEKLQSFARATQQPEPETPGQMVRCCLESLALCYAQTLDQLEEVLGCTVDTLHLVGGGTKNELLNELTCSVIGRSAVAGPVEATAVGNLLIQAIGCGELSSLKELRDTVAKSFPPINVQPAAGTQFPKLRDKFNDIASINL